MHGYGRKKIQMGINYHSLDEVFASTFDIPSRLLSPYSETFE
jgi:hypothetical protein